MKHTMRAGVVMKAAFSDVSRAEHGCKLAMQTSVRSLAFGSWRMARGCKLLGRVDSGASNGRIFARGARTQACRPFTNADAVRAFSPNLWSGIVDCASAQREMPSVEIMVPDEPGEPDEPDGRRRAKGRIVAKSKRKTWHVVLAAVVAAAAIGCAGFGIWLNSGDAVYAPSKITRYSDGSPESQTTITRDWFGRCTRTTDVAFNLSGALKTYLNTDETVTDDLTMVTYSSFDSLGFPESCDDSFNGKGTAEIDESDGRVNSVTWSYDDGSTLEVRYAYSASGTIAQRVSTYAHPGSLTRVLDETFNERGLRTSTTLSYPDGGDAAPSTQRTYDWTFSADGVPQNCTETTVTGSYAPVEQTYSLVCDEHGNIVQILDESGTLVEKVEYAKVTKSTPFSLVDMALLQD